MHCNHLPSPGLCKVFELGMDRANDVELLSVRPAFALFVPADGCKNILAAFKVERAFTVTANRKSILFQRESNHAGCNLNPSVLDTQQMF